MADVVHAARAALESGRSASAEAARRAQLAEERAEAALAANSEAAAALEQLSNSCRDLRVRVARPPSPVARVDSSSFLGSPTAASEEEVVVVPGSGAGSAELGRALMDAQAELAEKSSELAAARATIAQLEEARGGGGGGGRDDGRGWGGAVARFWMKQALPGAQHSDSE